MYTVATRKDLLSYCISHVFHGRRQLYTLVRFLLIYQTSCFRLSALGLINPAETFTSVYNLYFFTHGITKTVTYPTQVSNNVHNNIPKQVSLVHKFSVTPHNLVNNSGSADSPTYMAFRGRIQIELFSVKRPTAYFVPSITY